MSFASFVSVIKSC